MNIIFDRKDGEMMRYTAAVLIVLGFVLFSPAFTQEQSITLNLRNAPVGSVIYALASDAGLNVVTSDNMKGKVTVSVKDVSPSEALAAVIKAAGYTATQEGSIIKIIPPAGSNNSEQISMENGIETRSFTLNFVPAEDAKDMLSKMGIKGASIYTTKGSNVIMVEGPVKSLMKISKIIKTVDEMPSEVLVEARLMEVTVGNGTTPTMIGTTINYTGPTTNVQTQGLANPASAGGDPGFYAHVLSGNVESFLQMLEHKEGFNLLANPKVIAVTGKPASIISGSKLGYKTTLTTTTGTSQIVDFLEVGTSLTFTPFISSDGTIQMDIHPEVSDGSVDVNGLPSKQTTEATTSVIVRDGETIVIGGLIKTKSTEVENGIPGVMSLPIVGNFFKHKQILWEKDEIIAVLTPHLITAKNMKEMEAEAQNMDQKQKDANLGNAPNLWWWMK